MRKPYNTPYQSDSPNTLWTNARTGNGYEIRMDALNRFNVYRVAVSFGGYYKETEWVVTRIPWAVAPNYVHFIKEHMAAVLRALAKRETRET